MTVHAIPPVIALRSKTRAVSHSELEQVAHAMGVQLARDLLHSPWHLTATVTTGFPHGAWPVFVEDDIGEPGALGVHLDSHGQPYSLVQSGPGWPTTVSHEVLEMLVDPFGSRLVAGKAPDGTPCRLLIEVCDPCEAETYDIDGVAVSDFVYPAYYRTSRKSEFDYMGRITWGRGVLPGGYLSWEAPDGTWWQETYWGSKPETVHLGELDLQGQAIREVIDLAARERRAQ